MRRITIALALSACGGGGIDLRATYVSTHGVPYYESSPNEWHRDQIETQENAFILNASASSAMSRISITAALADINAVNVVDAPFACGGSPSGRCNGQEIGWDLEVTNLGCPFNSALAHEMLHWTFEYTGYHPDGDTNHRDPLWKTVDVPAGSCDSP